MTKKKTIGGPMRYPLAATGAQGNGNKQDMLYIKIFERVNRDILADGMFTTEYAPLRYKDTKQPVLNSAGEVVYQKRITGANALQRIDAHFNRSDNIEAYQKNVRYIYLPIPQVITDNTSVSYAQDTLNPLQVVGLKAASGLISDPAGAVAAGANAAQELIQAATALDGTTAKLINTALAGKAVNQLGGNVNATSLITRSTGQVLQSNMELLFDGPTLRSFPFVFDFTPRNYDEGQMVKKIIRTIKRAILPKNGDKGVFINSPDLFQLQYITANGQDHPFLNKFKIGAMSDISVNYAASGTYATYSDGTPVHIQMSLTFKELNPIYAEDFDNNDADGTPVGGVGY
tara:strand:- start:754 stop:1788 length:1035 start_codon:yes stop_codon:yes gene_type:complete